MNPWLHVFHPSLLARKWLRSEPNWSLKTKLELDWFPHPHYAYALHQASVQARRLGIDAIGAVEFGVGVGDGLAAMEAIASELVKETGVAIHTYGFDVDERVPSANPRDLPYATPREVRKLDRAALDARLKSSTLIIGDERETVPAFFENHDPPPVGFAAFALGDYTSTADALAIFDAPHATRLPRTFTYFDGIIGTDDAPHCEHAGELLAIDEFNRGHATIKLGRINGLRHKRVFHSAWTEQIFVAHDFAHPRYGDYTGPAAVVDAPPEG